MNYDKWGPVYRDKNGFRVIPGNIIDLHQTVNGECCFYVESLVPLDIRYNFCRKWKYEYNMEKLFEPCQFSGEVEFEIVKEENIEDYQGWEDYGSTANH